MLKQEYGGKITGVGSDLNKVVPGDFLLVPVFV